MPDSTPPLLTLRQRWQGISEHDQVGLCLLAMTAGVVGWALFCPVPTEVRGEGVLIYPDNAGVLDARAAGQVRRLRVRAGDSVRRGQVLMEIDLPVQEKQLLQQKGNLALLERQNIQLDERDALRLEAERAARDTALAKLQEDRRRFESLQSTYAGKLRNLEWLAKREVVAPLSSEVVGAEQGLTNTGASIDQIRIEEKRVVSDYEKVKLAVQTEALQRRYRIEDLRREIRVTQARFDFDGRVLAERDGQMLDLQVIEGQTVAMGQRLGTIGRGRSGDAAADQLKAVTYFSPADARRLPQGLPVEVVPLWNQRGRFGGIEGRVKQVLTLPATEEDISTTIGNPQLAASLVKNGPVMRAEIELLRDPASRDGYRWTLSRGSGVFPVREGLTVATYAYVEWRPPLSYLVPGIRSLTGGYRSRSIDRTWDQPSLRQPGSLP
ncbi:MAG: NHLP bacteriocin system secretion protein [Cyanobacteriota bacterium]|nr:NHLP bacteriocin system secretion protein [Cyanobacteriota bacterium]